MSSGVELSTDLINQISSGVRNGEWPLRCLVRKGVPQSEAQRWLEWGESRAQEGVAAEEDEYVRLFRAIDVAEADCEEFWIQRCRGAADAGRRTSDFTGFMTLLERRFPERWCVRGNQNRRGEKVDESFEEAIRRLQGEAAE